MDLATIREWYDHDMRRHYISEGVRREETENVVRYVDLVDVHSYILYANVDKSNVNNMIQAEIDYFTEIRQQFEWKWFDYDQPSDLLERLEKNGFAIGELEAVLALDLYDLPEKLLAPVTHDVRRITDPERASAILNRVQNPVFEDESDNWMNDVVKHRIRTEVERFALYAAFVDDQPASAAWIDFPVGSRFAGMWGGATLPEYRGKGLYTALIAARAQLARQREDIRFLNVDASPMSRPILEKRGFVTIAMSRGCEYSASASA